MRYGYSVLQTTQQLLISYIVHLPIDKCYKAAACKSNNIIDLHVMHL